MNSLSNGEILSWTDGKWGNIVQTPTTYPISLFQELSQKCMANGYAGLDNFSLIAIASISDSPQSKITKSFNIFVNFNIWYIKNK